jgi:hypothetical protein
MSRRWRIATTVPPVLIGTRRAWLQMLLNDSSSLLSGLSENDRDLSRGV